MSSGNRSEQAGGVNNTAFPPHMDPLGAPTYVNSNFLRDPRLHECQVITWSDLFSSFVYNSLETKPSLTMIAWEGSISIHCHHTLPLFFFIHGHYISSLHMPTALCKYLWDMVDMCRYRFLKTNHTHWVTFLLMYNSMLLNNVDRNSSILIGLFKKISLPSIQQSKM